MESRVPKSPKSALSLEIVTSGRGRESRSLRYSSSREVADIRLLTIYDLEVEATWTGKDSNGEEVKGTLKVPEVSHEAIDGLSDYVVSPLPRQLG